MMVDLVKAGKLPAVDQRLPTDPEVVSDREAIGEYGGELRMTMFDPVWWVSAYDLIVERMLVYSDKDGRTIVPNVIAGWEVTPDGKTYTLKLRKGMKWSDGQPFTTEDVRFWWEDFMTDTEINASPWWQFRFGGSNAKVEIVDDFTFKITFAAPFGNFPAHMTRWSSNDPFMMPSHYLKQFHAKYTDKATLEAAAKEKKLETWVQYFNSKVVSGVWGGPEGVIDYPTTMPWHVVANPSQGLYQCGSAIPTTGKWTRKATSCPTWIRCALTIPPALKPPSSNSPRTRSISSASMWLPWPNTRITRITPPRATTWWEITSPAWATA
jgi:ABC-type transport system substrate-binding protein